MSRNLDVQLKAKSSLLSKIKADPVVGHLYSENKEFISQKVDDFISTKPLCGSLDVDQFNQSLRQELYHSSFAESKPHKKYTYRIIPGRVPEDAPVLQPKQPKEHPKDIVDFMFQKQAENRQNFRAERTLAREKQSKTRLLTEYVPPPSLYAPPIQFYDKNRPYFQEYIRYRNELKPVVMPVFTLTKGSVRDKAKSAFMPVSDPDAISKRDQLQAERLQRLRDEERDLEKAKATVRARQQREAQRRREELQMSALASPIRPSSSHASHPLSRAPLPSDRSRPGTCNSFSPAALRTAYDRPDYPTAGVWITDV